MGLGNYSNGFSKARIFIVLALVLIVTGGFLGYQWYTSQQQENDAIAFSNSFVANISEQNYEKSYLQMELSAASQAGTIADWTEWVDAAKSNGVTINNIPTATEKHMIDKVPTYIVTYDTNSTVTFIATITISKSKLAVSSYAVKEGKG